MPQDGQCCTECILLTALSPIPHYTLMWHATHCQVVNLSPTEQDVSVHLHNITSGSVSAAAKQTVITGPSPQAENSFKEPNLVRLCMHEFPTMHPRP